jgi:hypothetical protein
MKIGNSSFERVEEFKYLGTTLTSDNCIQEEIKGRLKSGTACYHSVQSLLSSSLLSKNLKIEIYRTIILSVVLYGCETWSLRLREDRRLRALEKRVLRRIFGPKRDEITGEWTQLHNEELHDMHCSLSFIRVIKPRGMRWVGHVACKGDERCKKRFLWVYLKDIANLEDPVVDGRIILRCIFNKRDWFDLAQDGTGGGRL